LKKAMKVSPEAELTFVKQKTKVMAIEITDENFEELILKSGKPAMLDLWAEWCPPCLKIGPIVEELSAEYEGKAIVGKVNVDLHAKVSSLYGVRNIPTILYFKNGQMTEKHVGAAPKQVLEEKLRAQL
jgi:thioredoxin 1